MIVSMLAVFALTGNSEVLMSSSLFIQCVQMVWRSAKTPVKEPPIRPLMFSSPLFIGKKMLYSISWFKLKIWNLNGTHIKH